MDESDVALGNRILVVVDIYQCRLNGVDRGSATADAPTSTPSPSVSIFDYIHIPECDVDRKRIAIHGQWIDIFD